jgi:hypothetical protein
MKKAVYIFFLLISGNLFSQNLTDYIPQNTSYLFSINFSQLTSKSNGQEYAKFLEPFIRERRNYYSGEDGSTPCNLVSVTDMMKTPSEFGIDVQNSVFIYNTRVKDISGTVYLFRLAKPETFEARLNTSCKGNEQVQKKHAGQAVIYVSEMISVAVNGNVGIIFSKDYSYDYYNYDAPPEEQYNNHMDSQFVAENQAETQRIDSLFMVHLNSHENLDYEKEQAIYLQKYDTMIIYRAKQRQEDRRLVAMTKKFNTIFDLMEKMAVVQQENLTSNRHFMKLQQDRHDAFVYMNTLAAFNSNTLNPFHWRFRDREGEDGLIKSSKRVLTSDMSSSYTIDFENGKATMQVMSNYNKNVAAYMDKVYDVKQDKKLFKYIDAQNLLGYMSVAVNAKELAKFYEDFYRELLEGFPKSKNDNDMFTAMELFYSILDKEMLFNTLNGRSIFACTGFADIKVKYTGYDYDDEFNKTEKMEERVEKQPKMVWVSSTGNKENARKIFDMLGRFSYFTKLKDNVFAFYGTSYNPVSIYFALTEDAFIVTNDVNLVLNNLEGYAKDRLMAKSERKFITGHNVVFRVYGQKMLEGIKDTYFSNGETLPWFSQLMSNLGDLEMHDDKPGANSYHATAVVTLKDNSSNSLYQLLKMMSAIDGH